MNWIVKNLWLIPPLPILAADGNTLALVSGAEHRQKVAHGVSRGSGVTTIASPGGAKESVAPSGAWFDSIQNPTARAVGYLSPFHG